MAKSKTFWVFYIILTPILTVVGMCLLRKLLPLCDLVAVSVFLGLLGWFSCRDILVDFIVYNFPSIGWISTRNECSTSIGCGFIWKFFILWICVKIKKTVECISCFRGFHFFMFHLVNQFVFVACELKLVNQFDLSDMSQRYFYRPLLADRFQAAIS